MHKVTVLPYNETIEVSDKSNLRDSLDRAGYTVKSTCGGCATCGLCVVVLETGEDNISDIAFEEKQLLGNVFHLTKERLSCQVDILGDITVDISAHLPVKKVTKRRTKQQAESIIQERKEKAKDRPKKQGGFRRPKPFKTNKEDS